MNQALQKFGTICIIFLMTEGSGSESSIPIPHGPYAFLENFCLDCHDDFERKAEISLEAQAVDWKSAESIELWNRVIEVLKAEEMPPKKKRQPSMGQRASMVGWLDENLSRYDSIGGSTLRRLNRREYRNTLNRLFDINYELPDSFPEDNQLNGFDNQAEGLTLSGPLLRSYAAVAVDIAEKLFPPQRSEMPPKLSEVDPANFTYAYSSGMFVDGVMRVVSSSPQIAASATWPSRFEAVATGKYEVELSLSSFNPRLGENVVCRVYAVDAVNAPGENVESLKTLGEFEVSGEGVRRFHFVATLEKGQTVAVRYENASLSEDKDKLKCHLKRLLNEEPVLAAAYLQAEGNVARGRLGWEKLKELMRSERLPEPPTGVALDELVALVTKNARLTTEVLEYKHFEEGPALEIHGARFRGPIELVDGEEERYWKERASKWVGHQNHQTMGTGGRSFVEAFLTEAFRRPAPTLAIDEYCALLEKEVDRSGRLEDGLNLVVRTALVSPYFLYREFKEGPLDQFDLASRLSYFLTQGPPDEVLLRAVREGSLKDSRMLREQALRLIASEASNAFIESFLDQWLDLAALEDLVPDKTLFRNPKEFSYGEEERNAYVKEPNLFFREILDTNRPMKDFIDPDFTYTNLSVGRHVYELSLKGSRKDNGTMRRVTMERGGRFGGVLGMAGVMTATANGVDTQPVLRGVWMLENILGDPPRDPPDAVPALTPDTSKAETPREMLAAHMSEESCAVCHKKIDPIGFVLESYDPIGRWRLSYPESSSGGEGQPLPVETDGVLPDGTPLRDARDLKAYLAGDVTPFSKCLAEKLLTFATGRKMCYEDRKLIEEIVRNNQSKGEGFKDLLLDLIDSESFRTK